MTSIAERLRAYAKINRAGGSDLEADLEEGAADEIERLRANNARLREALLDLIDAYEWWCEDQYDRDQRVVGDAIYEARAALERKDE